MNQMQTPERDFLSTDSFEVKMYRSRLLPWWFHALQAVLLVILLYFAWFATRLYLRSDIIVPLPLKVLLVTANLLTLWMVAGFALIWRRWKYAVAFTLGPAITYAALVVLGMIGNVMQQGIVAFLFAAVPVAMFVVYAVRLMMIRKNWKEGIRLNGRLLRPGFIVRLFIIRR